MKKILAALVVAFAFAGKAEAGLFDSEVVLAQYVSPAAVTIGTAAIVVDLSNTTTWPHKSTSYARIHGVNVVMDQVAAGTSTVKIGVVTAVNSSSGTVTWFHTVDNTLNVSNTNRSIQNFPGGWYHNLRVREGGTIVDGVISNDQTTASTADRTFFQTDVTLPTTAGTFVAPAIGDIVAEIIAGATNGVKATISVFYTTP